jgi:DNA-binding response OmpR family regulator
VPVLCTHEELLAAIWDENSLDHTAEELNRLVWELRRKLPDPQVLQTERGLGYRLRTCRRAS